MELKPCPFCGSEKVRIVRGPMFGTTIIRCHGCGMAAYMQGPGDVAEGWNARAERTCSPTGKWESISQTQAVRHVFCSACGHEFGMDRKDTIPFERTRLVGLPYYCPECGARVTRKVVER